MRDKTIRRVFIKLSVRITVLCISIVSGCSQTNWRPSFYHEDQATFEYASGSWLAGNAKGKLVIVGGGRLTAEIQKRTLVLAGGVRAKVLVIPQAAQRADGALAKAAIWKKAGAGEVAILDLSDPKKAAAAVMRADLIWMPGGSQRRLMNALKDTGVPEAIRQRYRDGAVVGGTSAGAAVMSKSMISGDEVTAEFFEGLGLWPEAIVDQHFFVRRRFNRLLDAVLHRPGLIGVGIDERTALFLYEKSFEVIGDSSILILDARKAKVENGAATNIVVHVLRPGWPTIEITSPVEDSFDLGESILLEAQATTYEGSKVRTVEFIVDGRTLAGDTDVPYAFNWVGAAKGRHTVKAKVYDSKGRTKESLSVTVFVGMQALERFVTRSTNDAEEFGDGQMYLDSSDLELVTPDRSDQAEIKGDKLDQVVGIRFEGIRLAKGAKIKKAYLQFTVDEVDTEQTNLLIHAELSANAKAFEDVDGNITSRRKTTASVKWSPEPWNVEGERSEKQRTPDLSSLIQEVVAQSGWQEGNPLVFIITGSGERVAESYDGDQQNAPMLYVEY